MNIHIATEYAYKNGYDAGKTAAYDELIELFKDIPMWGTAAVSKIEALKEKK